jgi:hypothetical protein
MSRGEAMVVGQQSKSKKSKFVGRLIEDIENIKRSQKVTNRQERPHKNRPMSSFR